MILTTRDPIVEKIVLLKRRMIEIERERAELKIMNISIPPSGMHPIMNLFWDPELQKVVVDFNDKPTK